VPVAVGTVDALAEALSVGVAEPGDLMVMYGSTTFFILVTSVPVEAGSLWLTAGAERGRWALAGGLATGGSALAWFRDRFAPDLVDAERGGGPTPSRRCRAEAAARGAGGEDLLFLPYLSGERTPINDPTGRAVLAGASLAPTAATCTRRCSRASPTRSAPTSRRWAASRRSGGSWRSAAGRRTVPPAARLGCDRDRAGDAGLDDRRVARRRMLAASRPGSCDARTSPRGRRSSGSSSLARVPRRARPSLCGLRRAVSRHPTDRPRPRRRCRTEAVIVCAKLPGAPSSAATE
jgi:hypothetical protein